MSKKDKVTPIPPQPLPTNMPDINLREVVAPEVEALLNIELLSEEERQRIREGLVEKFNRVFNLPILGEHIEAAILRFAIKLAEKVILNIGNQLKDRVLRALD